MGIEAAIIASVVSTGVKIVSDRKAAKESRRARKAQAQIADLQQARERREIVRRARIRRAQIQAQAFSGGVGESSSAITGASGIGQQLASNLSFLDQTGALNRKANRAIERGIRFQEIGAVAEGIGSISNSFLGESGFTALGRRVGQGSFTGGS